VLLSLVGFQTRMRVGEQKRVFRALPGLSKAVFARFGSVHRNTYVNAPRELSPDLDLNRRPGLFLAGQMAGVEGYVESAALGLVVGIQAARRLRGAEPLLPDPRTAHGALLRHLRESDPARFQPSNVNYGLFPRLEGAPRLRKREKNERLAERALAALETWRAEAEADLA
jgi:methylenetetrahydrofolate--tRNA-(uracil-5-)-methyltransferase